MVDETVGQTGFYLVEYWAVMMVDMMVEYLVDLLACCSVGSSVCMMVGKLV